MQRSQSPTSSRTRSQPLERSKSTSAIHKLDAIPTNSTHTLKSASSATTLRSESPSKLRSESPTKGRPISFGHPRHLNRAPTPFLPPSYEDNEYYAPKPLPPPPPPEKDVPKGGFRGWLARRGKWFWSFVAISVLGMLFLSVVVPLFLVTRPATITKINAQADVIPNSFMVDIVSSDDEILRYKAHPFCDGKLR